MNQINFVKKQSICILWWGVIAMVGGWLLGCAPAKPTSPSPRPQPRPAYGKPKAAPAPALKRPRAYKVGSKWYRPLTDARGFRQKGLASWYGSKFHGKRTSNGEIYDMHQPSAAHKTLPLGTWVQVTNLKNSRQMNLRINDRGPFVQGRVIDLSYAAAQELGVVGPGTAPVEVVALGKATEPASKKPSQFEAVDFYRGNFTFQVGAFSEAQNAHRLMQKIEPLYRNVHVRSYTSAQHGLLYAVRVGQFNHLDEAENYKQTLRQQGFPDAFTVAE